jgi:hypothetical protein
MSCPHCPGAELPPRILILKRVLQSLSDGHSGVVRLLQGMAEDTTIQEDKTAFLELAAEHAEMATKSLRIALPDGMEEEDLNG